MQRRRHIRGGHFGALRKSTSQKKEGLMTVKRTRTICGGAEDGRISSISLNLSYVIYRHDLIQSTKKKPLLVIRKFSRFSMLVFHALLCMIIMMMNPCTHIVI